MRIVFARTRYAYGSYVDFWRLVDLSGFESCFVDEIRLDTDTKYVFTPLNGEVVPHLRNELDRVGAGLAKPLPYAARKTSNVVWWQLERFDVPDGKDPTSTIDDFWPYMDEIWISCRWAATFDPRLKYVTLGSHPGLMLCPPRSKTFDFTHQSYAWGRREDLYHRIERHGMSLGPSFAADQNDGLDRAEVVAASRTLVNAQQYESPIYLPLRFCLGAAHRVPVVTEQLRDSFPLAPGDFEWAPMGDLAAKVAEVARRPQADLDAMGERLHQRLCVEWTFRRGVEEAEAR